MRVIYLLVLVFLSASLFGQRFMVNESNDTLLEFNNNQAFSTVSGNVLYTFSDNKIFAGDELVKPALQYTIKLKDLYGKGRNFLIDPESGNRIWTAKQGTFFIGDSYGYDETEVLGWLFPTDTSLVFINGLDTSIMGQALGTGWEQNELMLCFELFKSANKLEAYWMAKFVPVEEINGLPPGIRGTIYPEYGQGTSNEWWWDGQKFYPRYTPVNGVYTEWVFDGENLQPRLGGEILDKYHWDGTSFEPVWAREGRDEFEWDGNTIEQAWLSELPRSIIVENSDGATASDMLRNARLRPIYDGQEYENFIVVGEIPVPLAILKIMGLANR